MQGHEVLIFHDDVSTPGFIPSKPFSIEWPHGSPVENHFPMQSESAFRGMLKYWDPDVVGFSCTTSDYWLGVYMASIAKEYGCRIVFGGPHASLLPKAVLCHADSVVVGEGESVVASAAFNPSVPPDSIIQAEPIIDLDEVLPARDMVLGGDLYVPYLKGLVQTQRGCPYSCGFCSAPTIFGSKVRTRNPQAVRDEIKSLGVLSGRLVDDSFAVKRDQGVAICEALKGLNFHWNCDMALRDIDSELAALMHGAGCYQINIGLESATQKWQELSGKRVSEQESLHAVELLKKNGMTSNFYFMVGYPGETVEEALDTLKWASRIKDVGGNPHISSVTPYPGTKLMEVARRFNPDWTPTYSTKFMHQNVHPELLSGDHEAWQEVFALANRLNG